MIEKKMYAGLDLGQSQDYTALMAMESYQEVERPGLELVSVGCMGKVETLIQDRAPKQKPQKLHERTYSIRHLERFVLGTSYPAICKRVVDLCNTPQLERCLLAVDMTGVGRAVVDMLVAMRPRAHIVPITITAGKGVTSDNRGGWHVAKKELVSVLQVLLQSRRLKIAKSLANAAVLVRELETFKVKVTSSANETFEAWREKDHDDLVLSVALATWLAERGSQQFWLR